MKQIRVRNLRSFSPSEEQAYIDIRPITVFVGKNSCGKSSLIRTLPLLRQSIESDTSGPILWYGTLVDYGAFSEVKNNKSDCEEIYFDYKFDLNLINRFRYLPTIKNNEKNTPVELELGIRETSKRTSASSLKIKINGIEILIDYINSCSIYVNGELTKIDASNVLLRNSLIPTIYIDEFDTNIKYTLDEKNLNVGELLGTYEEKDVVSREYLLKAIKHILTHYKSSQELSIDIEMKVLSSLNLSNITETINDLSNILEIKNNIESNDAKKIYSYLLVSYLPQLIDKINDHISNYASKVRYIAPLRATAERFYRFQDLKVEELDHTGSNLAMLLQNLTPRQISRFQDWSMENFGFKIHIPEQNSLHYEIKISIGEETHNISDMGFGFSQILPIVTSLWLTTNRARFNLKDRAFSNPTTLVIEQPELHLHPEFQSMLAKVFIKIVHELTKGKISLKLNIIFETHSKTMIDALGDYIEENKCPELVNIVIFNKKDGLTNVETSKFDEYGDLTNWPIGFFSGR